MSRPVTSLPIDALLPSVVEQLAAGQSLVLTASPGAGKTTRVPAALLDMLAQGGLARQSGSMGPGEVLVLEPRRLAAYLSATRVAEERGGTLGSEVGVQLRFESMCGPDTKLRFLTEGILLRRLLRDPALSGVAAVVLDEFHERHLQADLALALLRRLQRGARPDLRLCVMSATLETERLARFLGDCPVLTAPGREYEVKVSYLQEPDDRPLEKLVKSALLRHLQQEAQAGAATGEAGDVLVFLPGSAEIRRARDELAEVAAQRNLAILPLHGDLPLPEQRRAVAPRPKGAPRKIILSTNVAETSLTIDGVTVVIDSGLARVAGHSPWSGLPTLRVQRICQAAATQRAGRAGRTRPGRCLRLYTRHDHDARPAHDVPEIQRLDLCETTLQLRAAGLDPRGLDWLEPPREETLAAAERLLGRLGALSADGTVSEIGRQMAQLPLHPRLGRLVLEGAARHRIVGEDACTLAALLGERDLRVGSLSGYNDGAREHGADEVGSSDVLKLLELFQEAQRAQFDRDRLRRQGIDAGAAVAVDRVQRQLARQLAELLPPRSAGRGPATKDVPSPRPPFAEAREQALMRAILFAYPDRVARRREAEGSAPSPEVVMCGGGAAVLAPRSVVKDAPLLVVVDAEERAAQASGAATRVRGKILVRLASAIQEDWLLDLPASGGEIGLGEDSEANWNAASERVETVWRLRYDKLVLSESRTLGRGDDPQVNRVLREAALLAGPRAFADEEQLDRLVLRVNFLARHAPELGLREFDQAIQRQVLAELCAGRASFAELREAGLLDVLLARLGLGEGGPARLLHELAPEHMVLPGGRRVRVEYVEGQSPWIASRLQDFFGMAVGPSVARGSVPLVLHLLAPNSRPVQVTTDLAGFWERHYPSLRKELGRRYPRHPWPEDPLSATPPPPPPSRQGQGRPR